MVLAYLPKTKTKPNNRFWRLFLKEEILKLSIPEPSCVVSETAGVLTTGNSSLMTIPLE